MVSPGDLGNAVGDLTSGWFGKGGGWGTFYTYMGWIGWSLLILAVLSAVYYFMRFKYKLHIIDGAIFRDKKTEELTLRINKIYNDRAMVYKKGGVTWWRLMWSMKRISPFAAQYIMPGNKMFAFRQSGTDMFMPISIDPGNPSAHMTLNSFDAAAFHLGVQQDAKRYQTDDTMRKQTWVLMITIILCLVALVLTVWLVTKMTGKTTDSIDLATKAWQGVKSVAPT